MTIPRAQRVAVITGSYGAGHDAAARAVAARLEGAGCEVDVLDIVDLLPWRIGPLLRAVYYAQLRRRPRTWGLTLRLLEPGRLLHRLVTLLLGLMAARVASALGDRDLAVVTHPFGAQTLGHARAAGRLGCPVATYFTDLSVHALWVHPGVDLNLAIHQVAADDAALLGAVATVVAPAVPAPAPPGPDPLVALELVAPRALVTGGSQGIGELERTCRDILATGLMTPVVLCGTDASLRSRLDAIAGVVALGWRDDLGDLMASSACVVQNAGGFTALEALAAGVPVITYRPIPGHGETNSANLERAGLVPWARTPEDLALLLAAASVARRTDRLPVGAPDVATVLVGTPAAEVAA